MDEIDDIFKQIKRKENKYQKKNLVGLIQVSENQYIELEKEAKNIFAKYQYRPYLSRENSDILSTYAIIYDMYKYDGERFWESLALHFEQEEKYIRETTIEAMKTTYQNRAWSFYQTTRNEYVETIRMHGIIGNDSSGDKIIYALYVIYLKDFEKEVTEEKLDLFFPFLREIFRNYEDSSDEVVSNFDMKGIAYIRGQIPKSFIRAYLLNTSAVATLIKNIFYFFNYLESKRNKPDSLSERIENKIKTSFDRNNNFNNEYTRSYIYKKTPRAFQKDKVEYHRESVQLSVPTHFINFNPNEEKEVILKVYNNKQELKNIQLKTSTGGIGWKNEPVHLILGKKHKNIRYTLEKKDTKEMIYDSKEELFEKNIKSKEESKEKKKPIESEKPSELSIKKTKIYALYPNNQKDEKTMNQLKRGYIYEISPPGKLEIDDADYKREKDSLRLLITEETILKDDVNPYKIDDKSKLATYYEEQFVPNVSVIKNQLEFRVLKKVFKFSIILRYHYSLNDLELRINEESYKGMIIRKHFLKDVNVLEDGDLEYVLELSESLIAKEINSIQIFLNVDSLSLRYSQFNFYYDPEWSLIYQKISFQNKVYIQVKAENQLDEGKNTVYLTNQKLKVFLRENGELISVLLNITDIDKETLSLTSQGFIDSFLFDFESKEIVSNENKEQIVNKIRGIWNENLTQLINDLVLVSTSEIFIINLLKDYQSFKESLINSLINIESEFIDHVITELKTVFIGTVNPKSVYKLYVTKILRILSKNGVSKENNNKIVRAMRLYQVPLKTSEFYMDIKNTLQYQISDMHIGDAVVKEKISGHILPKNQVLSNKLYQLAMEYKGNEIGLIKNVREIQEEFPDSDAMTYYEVVILFHSIINEKKTIHNLSNSRLLMDVFYQFAIDYNMETICKYMNILEGFISRNKKELDSHILRKRLIVLAKNIPLEIIQKKDCDNQ